MLTCTDVHTYPATIFHCSGVCICGFFKPTLMPSYQIHLLWAPRVRRPWQPECERTECPSHVVHTTRGFVWLNPNCSRAEDGFVRIICAHSRSRSQELMHVCTEHGNTGGGRGTGCEIYLCHRLFHIAVPNFWLHLSRKRVHNRSSSKLGSVLEVRILSMNWYAHCRYYNNVCGI